MIAHPSLSMAGKKKGKVKFASAEAKQRHLKLEQEWAILKNQHGVKAEEKKRQRAMKATLLNLDLGGRETRKIVSKDTGWVDCTAKPIQMYTGDKMIGIAQMAKSNAVPVFRTEDVLDIARMRR